MQESERLAVEILPVSGEPATSVEPGDCSFDNPSFGQHGEGVKFITLDDLEDPAAAFGSNLCCVRTPIARVCKDAQNERKQGSRTLVEHVSRAIAILDIGGMNGGAQQEAERIYEKMALLALDLLSRVVSMRIMRPPFSALFTL